VDGALLGRDPSALLRVVLAFAALTGAGFVLNVASGLLYTRASAEALFAMRLDVYRHLQRLSPGYFARTALGDLVSRLNNDVSEVQRVAAETVLASVGNLLFLVGTLGMLAWLAPRLLLVALAFLPLSLWALGHYRRKLSAGVQVLRERSADIGSSSSRSCPACAWWWPRGWKAEAERFREERACGAAGRCGLERGGGLPSCSPPRHRRVFLVAATT
jgi:ATP-binding cassette subfamily B protein